MQQDNLFDWFRNVRSTDPVTAQEAAYQSRQNLSETLQKIHEYILEHPEGVTDEQIAYGLNMEKSSAAKRRGDLTKLGLVKDSGRIGLTHNNRKAIIWESA